MGKKIGRLLITLFGVFLGLSLVYMAIKNQEALGIAGFLASVPPWIGTLAYILGAVIFGIIFFFISPGIIGLVVRLIRRIERKSSELSMQQIFVGVIGLLIGLVIATLISLLIQKIPITAIVILLDVIVFVSLAYLGFKIPTSRIREFNLPNWFRRGENSNQNDPVKAKPKSIS